ncbi:aminotransferase, partial [Klebsiella oxytoca]
MKTYAQMTPAERGAEYAQLQERFAALKAKGLQLNMARGKPGKAQLDLVSDIFSLM